MTLDGLPFRPRSPRAAVAAGVRFVPADRKTGGAAAHMSLAENLFLNPGGSRPLRRSAERRAAAAILTDFGVRPPRPEAEFSTLSGGNAQKVVLARCLTGDPRLVVLCEPTAAVDVEARRQIHGRLRGGAADGTAFLLVSTDTEELADVCDEVLVVRRGRIAGVLTGAQISLQRLRMAVHDDV